MVNKYEHGGREGIYFMWEKQIYTELSNLLSSIFLSSEGCEERVQKLDCSWVC